MNCFAEPGHRGRAPSPRVPVGSQYGLRCRPACLTTAIQKQRRFFRLLSPPPPPPGWGGMGPSGFPRAAPCRPSLAGPILLGGECGSGENGRAAAGRPEQCFFSRSVGAPSGSVLVNGRAGQPPGTTFGDYPRNPPGRKRQTGTYSTKKCRFYRPVCSEQASISESATFFFFSGVAPTTTAPIPRFADIPLSWRPRFMGAQSIPGPYRRGDVSIECGRRVVFGTWRKPLLVEYLSPKKKSGPQAGPSPRSKVSAPPRGGRVMWLAIFGIFWPPGFPLRFSPQNE